MILASLRSRLLVPAQIGLTLSGLLAVGLAPPAQGPMMLMPGRAPAMGDMVSLAVANGARLLSPGPFGSMIVVGDRARLLGPMTAHGILVLAAPLTGCGNRGATS